MDATAIIGTEDEVAERIKRFADAEVDRMIISPVQGTPEERLHTVERLAELVGVGSPA